MSTPQQTPGSYQNAFRTNLFFEQIAARMAALPDLEWSQDIDSAASFQMRGYTDNPTPATIEIWHDPGPNQSNLFSLLVSSEDVETAAAANSYFEIRERIHDLLEASLVVRSVEEEIRATRDAERDILLLDAQSLTMLPTSIGSLHKHLKFLSLSHNRLTALPREIAEVTALNELAISHNRLEELPPGIGSLKDLRILNLSYNRLSKLPAEISMLASLRTLQLHRNRLEILPTEIGNLHNLRELNIEDNRLTHLPSEFLNLTSLKDVDLNHWKTRMKGALPPRNVRSLIAGENPWVYPPPEVIRRGTLAICEYLTANPDPANVAPRLPHEYAVYVDDSYHRMNETIRLKLGDFDSCESAIAACCRVVDEFFAKLSPGKTAAELFRDFKSFGENPFIKTTDQNCFFSAWQYAGQRSRELAAFSEGKMPFPR